MKNNIIYILFMGFVLAGCSSVVDNLNDDPNNPSDATGKLMLTGIQLGNVQLHEGELARLTGMWNGYFTGSDRQYIGLNTYGVTAGDFDSPWRNVYASTVAQARIAQEKAKEAKDGFTQGVASMIDAHAIGTAALLWGDIPNNEAANVDKFPEPSYDGQKSVLESALSKLDVGISLLGDSKETGSEATLFTGNADWSKVANTLKARYYLHMGDYAKALASASKGLMPGDNWSANHEVSGWTNGKFNLIFSFCIWYREGYMTAQDAHLALMLDPKSDKYIGTAKTDETARFKYYYNTLNWYGANYDPHWWAGGKFWRAEPYTLVTGEENALIMAEANLRLDNTAAAIENLNSQRGYLATNYKSTYSAFDENDFKVGGIMDKKGDVTNNILNAVLTEKYIALYGQIEGFNDTRRTKNFIGVPVKKGDKFPQRLIYPQSEINSNSKCPGASNIFEETPLNK